VSDVWKRELAALRAKIAELDGKLEELLAAGPVAPGVVEAAAELAHEAAQLEARMTGKPDAPPDDDAGATP
jgi:hypothetical protein